MNSRILCTLALALCATACLENEEEITIRSDGSATVRIHAKGSADDLAEGYPLPVAAPWLPRDDVTHEWCTNLDELVRLREQLRGIRPLHPKFRMIQDRIEELERRAPAAQAERGANGAADDLALDTEASFLSVGDLPRWFAPASAPYRGAYLERRTQLKVETKGRRTVYTFERTFGARAFEGLDAWTAIRARLSDGTRARLEHLDKGELPTAEERAELLDVATSVYPDTLLAFAERAILADFTVGDASLAPSAPERIRATIRGELARVVTRERLARILDLIPADDDRAGAELKAFEEDARAALRGSLERALRSESVARDVENAIRGELEWQLAAYDHTLDLGDESFDVTVHMPGTVVGGNFESTDGDAAHWSFEGERLRDRDVVLRVVSVVE